MNCNQKSIKLQKQISLKRLRNSHTNLLEKIISKQTLSDAIITNIDSYRKRIYTPLQTLSMFVSQSLNQDSSCQSVVSSMALKRKKSTSISTRARVEHIFGFMTNSMNDALHMKSIGLKRIKSSIGFLNLTYNFFRYEQLVRPQKVRIM